MIYACVRRDLAIGLKEFLYLLPIALALGVGLRFLHFHPLGQVRIMAVKFAGAWIFTFFFIAVPEELFFRGWLQNLLERTDGPDAGACSAPRSCSGFRTSTSGAVHFNWRYVLLAAIAGVFYGRAWRRDRRVGASAVTHATVDSVWSLWLR